MKVVKLLMEDAGISQRELSERTGINTTKLSWLVNNGVARDSGEAARLSEALGFGGDTAVLSMDVPTRDVLMICEGKVQR